MPAGGEVPVLVVEAVGGVEPVLQRQAVHMPFPRVIRAVAERFQHLGQEPGPRRPSAPGAARDAGDGIPPHLLGVVPREKRRPRRPATGRVVELREPEAILREVIEVGRGDLATIASGIRETHVVREDDEDVGPLDRRIGSPNRVPQSGHDEQGEQEPCHEFLPAWRTAGRDESLSVVRPADYFIRTSSTAHTSATWAPATFIAWRVRVAFPAGSSTTPSDRGRKSLM